MCRYTEYVNENGGAGESGADEGGASEGGAEIDVGD